MSDLISKTEALALIESMMETYWDRKQILSIVRNNIEKLPVSGQGRECVDLSEVVTATYYDDECEEWSQKTTTIRDILDSVCDEYTVLSLT